MSRSLWEQWARAQRSQIDENDGLGGFWSRWKVLGNAGFRTVMFRRPPGGVGSTEIVLWRARGGVGVTKILFWRVPGGAGSRRFFKIWLRRRWIDKNSGLEPSRRRWIDKNSVLEGSRRRSLGKNSVFCDPVERHDGLQRCQQRLSGTPPKHTFSI